jgi:uncharacterized membrane protein YphA (DoxX/SURF4 family)
MSISGYSHETASAASVALITKTASHTRAEQIFSQQDIVTDGIASLLWRSAILRDRLVATWLALFEQVDVKATSWMARHGIAVMRVSLGLIFFWFGVLKFFPGMSPAQDLAIRTTSILTFGLVPPHISLVVLAAWECVIGLGLMFGLYTRATLLLLFLQMAGTLTPLAFFPHELFTHGFYAPTLEGQYIIKNLVLISAGIVIGATVRGGAIVPERQAVSPEERGDDRAPVRRSPYLVTSSN